MSLIVQDSIVLDRDYNKPTKYQIRQLFSFDNDFTQESETNKDEYLFQEAKEKGYTSNIDYYFNEFDNVDDMIKDFFNRTNYYKDYKVIRDSIHLADEELLILVMEV